MLTRVYRDGVLEQEGFHPAEISDLLEQPDTVVWLDVCRPTAAELAVVAEELGLHPLAQEDAVGRPQRPKLEPYAGHQFLVAYGARWDVAADALATDEVAIFFSARWIVTVRKDDGLDLARVLARWDGAAPGLARHGVPFLLHGVLDELVESYFSVVEALDGEVELIEDALFGERVPGREVQRRVYGLRKALVALRRVVVPMREVVNGLLLRTGVPGELRPHYQDLYDHVIRAAEWVDSLRDLVTSATETYLTIQGNRLNEIMKQLTSYAAIVAVPTAVAGIYGMNTRIYPGAGTAAGWWVAIGLMTTVSAGLFVWFRRKDWL